MSISLAHYFAMPDAAGGGGWGGGGAWLGTCKSRSRNQSASVKKCGRCSNSDIKSETVNTYKAVTLHAITLCECACPVWQVVPSGISSAAGFLLDALLMDPLVFSLLFAEGGVPEELVLGCCPLEAGCAAATGFPNSSKLIN